MSQPPSFHSRLIVPAACLVLFLGETAQQVTPPSGATRGMVVSADSLASAAGVAMLNQGGNAIDAAVAVGFALAVTYPEAGNIGGGGFMVVRMADGRSTMIDFREKAPRAATRTMFLDSLGKPVPGLSTDTPLAAGVPGSVDGLLLAQARMGRLTRAAVLRPAVELAAKGFVVDSRLERSLRRNLSDSAIAPAVLRIFGQGDSLIRAGGVLRQPDLARTLRAVAEHGREGFYGGEVAALIAGQSHRDGGIITLEDLARYRAVERKPVTGSYRGYTIISAAPPSSGGTVLLEMLNILELYPLASYGADSPITWHLFAAAAQRAFADRASWLGDPDFVPVPVDTLVAKSYARRRAASIDPVHAVPAQTVQAGGIFPGDLHPQTTHYSVVDGEGNVVSVTTTLNGLYGCHELVEGAGFFLNNEMDDFAVAPGVPNMFGLLGGDANAVAPEKRMLSSMTPAIVVREGKPVLVTGARGGSRIITTVARVIVNRIDFGMDAGSATAAPRVHCQWYPDELVVEPDSAFRGVVAGLDSMGYHVRWGRDATGESESIFWDSSANCWRGGADPREGGVAVGQ